MAQPYVGEIRMFAGNFAPAGWMFCEGQLLPISEYDVLFNLIGTTYGGDGQETFALPDLRGRLPLHQGNGFIMGQLGGAEQVTLTTQQIPRHNHSLLATTNGGTTTNPPTNLLAKGGMAYIEDVGVSPLNPASLSPAGGSQPHSNLQPFLCIDFIISLFGIFPSQT
jgi:microcystin-dependent protein